MSIKNIFTEKNFNFRKLAESLGDAYIFVYLLNLETDEIREVVAYQKINLFDKGVNTASAVMKLMVDNVMQADVKAEMEEFYDLTTLAERLAGKRYLSVEYISNLNNWCRGTFTPIDYDENGKIVEVMYKVQRIENEKKLEIAHEAIIKALSDNYVNVYLLSPAEDKIRMLKLDGYVTEGIIDFTNEAFDYWQYAQRFIADRVYEADKAQVTHDLSRENLVEKLQQREDYNFSYRVQMDGEIHYFQGRMMPTDREGWGILAFQSIDNWISEERTRSKQLQEALQVAEVASQAKTSFLSNMSHDIRTPMNAIIGYTAIASSHLDDKVRVRTSLRNIMQAGEHLQGLINDILDMSRIESGKEKLNIDRTKLTELVRGILPMVQSQIERKNINLYVDTISLKNDAIYADAQKMRQILLNVVSNAVKYNNDGGQIIICIKQKPYTAHGYGSYKITIRDNGIGMTADFVKHVFEPFEQANKSDEAKRTGTGLGMSIAKAYVNMMGGEIKVTSELGKGTEFTIDLEFKLQEEEQENLRIASLKGFRALVVDDDFQTCDSVTHMLEDVGMRCDWTLFSREALLRAQKAYDDGDSYFAYIIDWVMPEMNGIELTRQIRKIAGDDVPIIILTAYSWADVIDEAKAAGATALCTKPLFIDDLTNIFLNNMDGKHQDNPEQDILYDKDAMEQFDFEGERVLLVEDNEMNREIAQIQLEEMGLTVSSAVDGAEALAMMEQAEDWEYDYILMDVRMPVMNGLEATKAIRAIEREYTKAVPIIALTANAFDDDVKNCLHAGMNMHVSKPFEINELALVLKTFDKSKRRHNMSKA